MVRQASSINVCEIADEVKDVLKKMRFRKAKTNAAVILKIDFKTMIVNIDGAEMEDITIEEVGLLIRLDI